MSGDPFCLPVKRLIYEFSGFSTLPHVGGEVCHHVAERVEASEGELDEEASDEGEDSPPRDHLALDHQLLQSSRHFAPSCNR